MTETRSHSASEHSSRQTHLDVLKGLLILLVVLGHNKLFTTTFDSLHVFRLLYAFHVQSFFFVSAITNRRPINVNGLTKRLKSYLYPQLIFFSLLSVMFYNVQSGSPDFHFGGWFFALISGSAPLSRIYSGVAYLWFLPALLGFYVVLSTYNCLQKTYLKILAAVGLFLLAVLLYGLGLPMERAPFGLSIAIFIVPVSLLVRFLYDRYAISWITLSISIISVFACYPIVTETVFRIGAPEIFNHAERSYLIVDILFMMACFFCLNYVSIILTANRFLAYLGRNSLQVYLVHQVFHILIIDFFLLRKKMITLTDDTDRFTMRLASLVVFVIVVLLSTGVVWLSERRPVCWLFFPSSSPPQNKLQAQPT